MLLLINIAQVQELSGKTESIWEQLLCPQLGASHRSFGITHNPKVICEIVLFICTQAHANPRLINLAQFSTYPRGRLFMTLARRRLWIAAHVQKCRVYFAVKP